VIAPRLFREVAKVRERSDASAGNFIKILWDQMRQGIWRVAMLRLEGMDRVHEWLRLGNHTLQIVAPNDQADALASEKCKGKERGHSHVSEDWPAARSEKQEKWSGKDEKNSEKEHEEECNVQTQKI
jgi:hypothetical protein